MLGLAMGVWAAPALGGNISLKTTMQNLYNVNSCAQVYQDTVKEVCCRECSGGLDCDRGCLVGHRIKEARYDYWEPAAIIEVSCRSGFSHLSPGIPTREGKPQSCTAGPNWFFEARVWASSGRIGGDREAALGRLNRVNLMRCQADPTSGAKKYPNGYGIKHEGVTFDTSGPGRSSTAYISENDPSWAQQRAPFSQSQPCNPQSPTVEACWGNPNTATGWVTHPNQAVAAALAGYRALNKAMAMRKVVTPRKDSWRMSMDYPFIMSASPAAQSMGLSGGVGRHMGSACFNPGHPGPAWYTAGRANAMPNQMSLRPAQAGQAAYVPDGVYIFTYWVRTGCTVYEKEFPGTFCMDDYKY